MKMKSSLTTAIVLFSVAAFGQGFAKSRWDYGNPYNGGTNVIPVLSSNVYVTIPVAKSTDVGLFVAYKWHSAPSSADAKAPTLEIYRGFQNGMFESNVWQRWTLANNTTTTPSSEFTNITVGHVPELRVRFVGLSTNAIGTNVLLTYTYKN